MRRTNQEFKEEIFRRELEYRNRRKRWNEKAVSALVCVVLVIFGCGLAFPFLGGMGAGAESAAPEIWAENGSISDAAESPAAAEGKLEYGMAGGTAEPQDVCPAVMIDGVLYFDTGRINEGIKKCGTADGTITSRVDGSRTPTEDDQSNFGIGYGYQYGETEGTVEIYLNGKWCIFATEKVKDNLK